MMHGLSVGDVGVLNLRPDKRLDPHPFSKGTLKKRRISFNVAESGGS